MMKFRGQPWAVLVVVSLGFFMTLLDLTIRSRPIAWPERCQRPPGRAGRYRSLNQSQRITVAAFAADSAIAPGAVSHRANVRHQTRPRVPGCCVMIQGTHSGKRSMAAVTARLTAMACSALKPSLRDPGEVDLLAAAFVAEDG